MALGTRAISRIQGSGNGGFAGAKKLADLYVATNTNDAGEVKDPAVYDKVMEMLAPYAGTLDGQNLIADYNNKKKKLSVDKSESQTTVAALRQKEYSAWYVNDDGEDNTSFRNPGWVAQVTSESLDMILAETLEARQKAADAGKSTAELDSYITELSQRSDRMRTVATQLQDGGEANLDGYGYYVDADPNTGVIRGASFMPTDTNFKQLSDNTLRTSSTVNVNGKKVPVYLPYVQDQEGTKKAMFGGIEYTAENDANLLEGDGGDVAFTDRARYQHNLASIEMNKIYSTFTGKTNVDGSYKKDYIYVSPENKVYRFSEDDPKGKELISSLQNIAGMGEIQRLSPADVNEFYTEPLPDDSAPLTNSMRQYSNQIRVNAETERVLAESERVKNMSSLDVFSEMTGLDQGLGTFGKNVVGGAKIIGEKIGSFFGAKNRPNVPDQASASVNGQTQGNEVVAQGAGFFRNKV